MNNFEYPIIMSQNVYSLFDALSFIAAIASLILAFIAIWLSLSFKRDTDKVNKDTDKVNKQTSKLLVEIKSESMNMSQGIMSELKAYGHTMRNVFGQNVSTDDSTFIGTPENFSMSDNTTSNNAKDVARDP